MTSEYPTYPPITSLVVQVGQITHTLDPAAGVALIGREAGVAIEVDDERISRLHVRLEPHRDGWQAIDTSANGMFIDGVRRNSVLVTGATTLYLGAPDGVAVTLTPGLFARFTRRVNAGRNRVRCRRTMVGRSK